MFINATFFGAATELRGERVATAIGAAAEAGASRIVVTTWPNLDRATLPNVQDYARSERLVRKAGPSWTILRLGYGLADAAARDVIWARRDGELIAPAGRARCVPAAASDLADAAAITIARPGHENTTYELTGPRAIDWSDLAALAGSIDGRSIRYRAVEDDEYREYLAARGIPGPVTDGLLGLYAEFRSGWAATRAPTSVGCLAATQSTPSMLSASACPDGAATIASSRTPHPGSGLFERSPDQLPGQAQRVLGRTGAGGSAGRGRGTPR